MENTRSNSCGAVQLGRTVPPQDRRFRGGYTVITHGSHNSDGMDAIQLEIGSNLRKNPKFAKDLTQAIATFYKSYLAHQTR